VSVTGVAVLETVAGTGESGKMLCSVACEEPPPLVENVKNPAEVTIRDWPANPRPNAAFSTAMTSRFVISA
jgi:hypothetical protein